MIKKINGKYVLHTSNGARILGVHATKQEAVKQEIAIKISQAQQKKGKK